MKPFKIFVFGNQKVKTDSVPLKILPKLKEQFPQIKFIVKDPTEVINHQEDEWWILDTVQGVNNVTIIDDPSVFANQSSLSVHDYDLTFEIKLLLKLGKLKKIKIVAIPHFMQKDQALVKVTKLLSSSGF